MRAIHFETYNAPFRPVHVPLPELQEGQVLVKMTAAAVNMRDHLIRSGMYRHVPPPLGPSSPVVGNEGAGIVVATRERRYPEGTRVFFSDGYHLPCGGVWQEYVVADIQHLHPVPPGKSLVEAAALRTAFQSAWMALEQGGFRPEIEPTQVVLAPAIGSGVGNAAVQLVRASGGPEALTTAGSSFKAEHAQGLGYRNVIDLSRETLQAGVARLAAGGVDVALDLLGGTFTAQALSVLKPGRALTLVGYASGDPHATIPLYELIGKKIELRPFNLLLAPQEARSRALEHILRLWQENRIQPHIDRVFHFTEAEQAMHHLLHGRPFGKVLLLFDEGKHDERE
ncbi:NADPH:quinone reductase-like Zn-dependent oxidoreductase [Thermosporothrix hazakensis]|jgi:NADPH:quinone reductase-like Zn-dependent oxidoreductase|uniref:NADPH:quinone reductase-like Zn-dependent oxidoreductase n=1 Tax=Thermosporothrix hazakensis TaxID=644383 RepID=A0A326TRY3_THEHA|nr:zinc-binding alcohol dehydrogenase family protein [Thermosporothrix hazakensis]PZW18305.1 NADPH:quinone reductase-like Zn-dependent oxidoreductase [Thermosporothrix hazakensis]